MSSAAAGNLLRVDLSTGRCRLETLPETLLQQTLGGRSLGVSLLEQYTGRDPLQPDMPLVFAVGPLCGTPVPMSTRCVLSGRSPLTGTMFSVSAGGPLAACLTAAGLTAVLVQGAAATPVLLEIAADGARLVPADRLWGLGCHAALQRLEGAAAAVIGPAGERLVRFASLESGGGEPFGRGGFGAVLGSKRLKGIVVRTLPGQRAIVDRPGFDRALEDLLLLFRASPFLLGPLGIREQGTATLVDLMQRCGMLPGRSFADFTGDHTAWNAHALRQRRGTAAGGCHDCQVACKRLTSAGAPLTGYDELAAFGGLAGVGSLDTILRLCDRCRDLGLDPLSAAGALSVWFAVQGRVPDDESAVRLLEEIADGSGQGALLAQGGAAYAAAAGCPDQSMTVKGLELPPYDPRASTGLALAYAVSPHGGCHLTAWPIASEILRKPVPTDRFSFDGKARVITVFEDAGAALDSLVLCRYAAAAVDLEELAPLLAAVSGRDCSAADLRMIGRGTVLKERAYNRANGWCDADDRLPSRFFDGGANGLPPLDRRRFADELAAYHRIRGRQP